MLKFECLKLPEEMPQSYRRPPSPPPSYEEVAKVSLGSDGHHFKTSFGQQQQQQLQKPEKRSDELPPEYSAAVAMNPSSQLLSSNESPVL